MVRGCEREGGGLDGVGDGAGWCWYLAVEAVKRVRAEVGVALLAASKRSHGRRLRRWWWQWQWRKRRGGPSFVE